MKVKRRSASAEQRGNNLKRFLALPFVAILLVSLLTLTVCADPGWDYYREIKIDSGKVNGSMDLPNFPVLVTLTADWLKYENMSGHVREEHGYDIVFTNEHNTTLLDFEIEEYNGTYNATHGMLVAWVRIPALDHDDNTTIRLWYGNSQATDWSNAAGVWDTNYKGVWHLKETTGGTDAIKDSTSNANDGTDYGSPNLDATGQIDGADDFDGANDYINCGNGPSLNISDAITIEAWVKEDSCQSSWDGLITKSTNSAWTDGYGIFFNSTRVNFWVSHFSGNAAYKPLAVDGNWHHIVGTYDKNAGQVRIFVDGIEGTPDNYNLFSEDVPPTFLDNLRGAFPL
jgi:hypothetical protein